MLLHGVRSQFTIPNLKVSPQIPNLSAFKQKLNIQFYFENTEIPTSLVRGD
jgi:L-ribulose-5-phosphate 3-epimerase UlaE